MNVALQFRWVWHAGKLHEPLQRSTGRERQAGRSVVGPQYDNWEVKVAGQPAGFYREAKPSWLLSS